MEPCSKDIWTEVCEDLPAPPSIFNLLVSGEQQMRAFQMQETAGKGFRKLSSRYQEMIVGVCSQYFV